jgi:hypothetical protein
MEDLSGEALAKTDGNWEMDVGSRLLIVCGLIIDNFNSKDK